MKKPFALILTVSMILSCAACSKSEETAKKRKKVTKETTEDQDESDPSESGDSSTPGYTSGTDDPSDQSVPTGTTTQVPSVSGGPVTTLNMFICTPGNELSDNNDIQNMIRDMTGVEVNECYLIGTSESEAIGSILASGDLPEFIYTNDSNYDLYRSGVLLPWDSYLDDPAYSNLRSLYTDAQWELFRQDDGHIYWVDVLSSTYGKDQTKEYSGCAFWIQTRVLEWAGYPVVTTLDEYFYLLETYYASHPTNEDGTDIIPFTALNDNWRAFTLWMPPCLIDGYTENYPFVIDSENYDRPTVVDINTSDTFKSYYRKLNECYNAGLIDPDFATMSYDNYIGKLSSGAVLGMFDAYWDFGSVITDEFRQNGMSDLGYEYVPLALTLDPGMENRYYRNPHTIVSTRGLAVTTACKDPDLVFGFLNRILDQDIHNLRFWGMENEDYLISDEGLFYRTDKMIQNSENYDYCARHFCPYSYLPSFNGTSRDELNAMKSSDQADVFLGRLPDSVLRCFQAYGYQSYSDFLRSSETEWEPWYPISSFTNSLSSGTPAGVSFIMIDEVKYEYIPQLVTTKDFDAVWEKYVSAYESCDPDLLIAEAQEYVDEMVDLVG
ncbi:MAG: sugar ABC transporter substrate-binding protein [Clostridiales bacterium]|nr:sugar ABC transporter substrate-binding protein [Clostridiales bacterium]